MRTLSTEWLSRKTEATERLSRDGEERTFEQLREHYLVECEIADRLRRADKAERRGLYTAAYDEMLRRVPHHPRLTRKETPESRAAAVRAEMSFLGAFLEHDQRFLEMGAGSCSLTLEVAKHVGKAIAYEVSNEIVKNVECPPNVSILISDGTTIPLPSESVDLVYSNQVMEHVHPDDAYEQLKEIYRVLTRGGRYICITPNVISGPHDISRLFDDEPRGFHLKEYTVTELVSLFRNVGFSRCESWGVLKGRCFRLPLAPLLMAERMLMALRPALRKKIARARVVGSLLAVRVIGYK